MTDSNSGSDRPQQRREHGPLVVVSNRLPYNLPRHSASSPKRNVGGLVNALEPVLARRGGCWVGWDGLQLSSAAAVASALSSVRDNRAPTGVKLCGVPLSEREVSRYYHGLSNRALWPLFHDFPGMASFHPDDWSSYERVNRRFARVAYERAGESGRIWVHDYHLFLVPHFLREMGFRGRIDFFLHIPFPAAEIFRALPWRSEVLQGLLASDHVAFHAELYRRNFVESATQLSSITSEAGEEEDALVRHGGGSTRAFVAPIGIDVVEFERLARLPSVQAHAERLREAHRGCRILFGADRLDYTKGIMERLSAVERYLARRPDAAGRVVLIQIVVPSRSQVEEYRLMKREIDREVGRINGERGGEGWFPIHYRYQSLNRKELIAHYLAADAALVTPLRDGMNLVASEFAAARVDEDGVLILSEFAGVAERSPGAVLVNPYDVDGCAKAIGQALQMDTSERITRMKALRGQVRSNPLSVWSRRCLGPDDARTGGDADADADAEADAGLHIPARPAPPDPEVDRPRPLALPRGAARGDIGPSR